MIASNQAIFSNPAVLSDVAIIQIGSNQSANIATAHRMAKPKEMRGITASSPKITKKITIRFPITFMTLCLCASYCRVSIY